MTTITFVMILPLLGFMLVVYCLFRRCRVDSSARSCSDKFSERIKTATQIDCVDVDKMFYTNEEVFWRFWDWSDECSIRNKKMYHSVIGNQE